MNENYLNENINQVWCSIIIDQLCYNNIDNFYLAPGMRNAPLLRAASNHSKSKWTIWSTTENPNCDTSLNQEKQIELTLSQIQNEEQNSNWTIKWQAEKGRFVTSKKETEISATVH